MKKIILLAAGLFVVALYSESGRLGSFQERRAAVCSLCGHRLIDEDFLQGVADGYQGREALMCRFCLKKTRGKGGKGEATEGALVLKQARGGSPLVSSSDDDGAARADESMPVLRVGRRAHIVLLREARTGSERKNKHLFRDLMEEEARVAQEHAWSYRLVPGIDQGVHKLEVRNGAGFSSVYSLPRSAQQLWYKGSCIVSLQRHSYVVRDFSSGDEKKFFSISAFENYLERTGYGPEESFKKYDFEQPVCSGGGEKQEGDQRYKKSILASAQKRKEIKEKARLREEKIAKEVSVKHTPRLLFVDEPRPHDPLRKESPKSNFYYATADERKTLLVGNDDGYILKWPVEGTIIGLLTRGTEAVITTQAGAEVKQMWHDFARHNEDQMLLGQDYPITVLELPVQSKEELRKQGFSDSLVSEKTFDQMFHEVSVIPEGFVQTFHPPYSVQEVWDRLRILLKESDPSLSKEELRSVSNENDRYECLRDSKENKINLIEAGEIGEEFEITLNDPKDRIWKRGAEVLIPDNGCLILYNFKTELVERFDLQKSSLEEIEKKLPALQFSEIISSS